MLKDKCNKIGLVTLWEYNYGSMLQCYATVVFLKSQGYECLILDIGPTSHFGKIIHKLTRFASKSIHCALSREYLESILLLRNSTKQNLSKFTVETKNKMNDFVKTSLKPKRASSFQLYFESRFDDYLAFFVGSDQIWHGIVPYERSRFLKFAPSNKRISWITSFGVQTIPHYNIKKFKRSIMQFSYLSVREREGSKIIKELCNLDSVRLLDPTTLITIQEWRVFASKGKRPEEKFALIHFLGAPNSVAIHAIRVLMEMKDITVVAIGPHHEEIERFEQIEYCDASAYDYVKLIDSAEIVFTDSFHTTIFSIIMQTNFYTFCRQYLHGKSEEIRKVELLGDFGLTERFIETDEEISNQSFNSKIDFSATEDILYCNRMNTIAYLEKCLQHS